MEPNLKKLVEESQNIVNSNQSIYEMVEKSSKTAKSAGKRNKRRSSLAKMRLLRMTLKDLTRKINLLNESRNKKLRDATQKMQEYFRNSVKLAK